MLQHTSNQIYTDCTTVDSLFLADLKCNMQMLSLTADSEREASRMSMRRNRRCRPVWRLCVSATCYGTVTPHLIPAASIPVIRQTQLPFFILFWLFIL